LRGSDIEESKQMEQSNEMDLDEDMPEEYRNILMNSSPF
jgi:hypothetical protein